jgi:Tol biopolymer transport system component
LPAALSAAEPKLLLSFSSYRERNQHPQIYFYEHDGEAMGKIEGGIPTVGKRSDYHSSLSADGRRCAFAAEIENETSRILLWDRTEKKLVEMPAINDSPNAQLWPALSGDGRQIVFAAWNRPDSSQRWDLLLYDTAGQRAVPLFEVNTLPFDERMPALSGDGKLLAYVTNAKGGAGTMDIALCDLKSGAKVPATGLNTEHREVEPSLSADGRLVAFSSDRPGGLGGRDVYLFDRTAGKLVPLPNLNSVAHEQTPSLTPDGKFIAFVSERIAGEGERDIFLYDVERQRLLPTPSLNVRQEDIDPCVIALK